MASVDSGGRSNFSQTCSLLRQYLKEKNGSLAELTLGLTPTPSPEIKETMNFLSAIENKAAEVETAAMTIFYGGKVMVYNEFPAERAQEILALASTASAQPSLDLPIARKNSLASFLEKRRDRITAKAPYPPRKATPWLGLAPRN
ncbi:protein TIFY 11c-like [Salvia hispanica]|uniref:protein TIFY 11c-like n=1 Tax=Salvia hispanica TaxID=49212 RepID=UPI0020095AF9|nr:protein TIFY 11c-like [Salvia hispanica]